MASRARTAAASVVDEIAGLVIEYAE